MSLIATFSLHYHFHLCIPLITTFSSPDLGGEVLAKFEVQGGIGASM